MTSKLTDSKGRTIYTDANMELTIGAHYSAGRTEEAYMALWLGKAASGHNGNDDGFEDGAGARLEFLNTPIFFETLTEKQVL